ncbi:hypothetical protein [Vulcanisaeta sp. JCM 16161]|uniref:hypothetical protein n=1 Tax=Vulcanisaeta sp. JCM 16161 TaxID=1295372 RepID=UPI000B27D642|nr:hypothetical protein [Vulcanisaeta sp. JCM 16161]
MDLAIYAPRIEASMPMLRNILIMAVKRYKSLSLPLPREFCRLAVINLRRPLTYSWALGTHSLGFGVGYLGF